MDESLQALSEREKDALRLLLGGHDAKSIARSLNLSVHTVNERLRDARRKLGVSSSREAARRLAEAERGGPDFLADKQLGVGGAASRVPWKSPPDRRPTVGLPLAWLGGGMLIMSLIIAAVALSSAFHPGEAQSQAAPRPPVNLISLNPSDALSSKAALEWVALLDGAQWDASWEAAGTLFRSQLPKERWASMIRPVRLPLGAVSSRVVQSVTRTTSLPNAPAGDYAVLLFQTRFAQKPDAIETVILARGDAGWKVDGYFIR